MLEGLKDMGKLLKQAKEMKGKMKAVQDELKKTLVVGFAEGEKIKIEMTGELECTKVEIDPSLLAEGQQRTLQQGMKKAINDAATKAKNLATSKLSSVSGDLNLPGL